MQEEPNYARNDPILMQMSAKIDRAAEVQEYVLKILMQLSAKIDHLRNEIREQREGLQFMSDTIASEIAALTASVAAETSVEASAVTLIDGFAAQLAAAIAAAAAAGATPAQLQSLNTLTTTMGTSSTDLARAVAQNIQGGGTPSVSSPGAGTVSGAAMRR